MCGRPLCQAVIRGHHDSVSISAAHADSSYDEVLSRKLKVMDLTAITLARDSRIPVIVFSIRSPGALTSVAKAQGRYTIIGA